MTQPTTGATPAPVPAVLPALQATVLFPAGVLPKLQKGLRTQSAVDAKDLAEDDLRNLVITVNGKPVPAASVNLGAVTWDSAGRISVNLTLTNLDIPTPWRIQVATQGGSIVLISSQPQSRHDGGETHVLSAQSTAHALLSSQLAAEGRPDAAISQTAVDLLAQRLEHAFTSNVMTNPLEASAVVDAVKKLTNAISGNVPDAGLAPILNSPAGGGGGGGGGSTHVVTPSITAITPNHGPVNQANAITVTGTNFATGATVLIGNQAADNVIVVNATTITATVPAGQPLGAKTVTVTNPDTQFVKSLDAYTVDPPGLDASATLQDGQHFTGTPVGGNVN
jgi:hypothetical protein